jgi:hypothetical protein
VCSDCGRQTVGGELVHDPTCPAARGLDDLMVSDAGWFEERSGARHRCRWITAVERMELGDVAKTSLAAKTVIHVEQLQQGMRRRAVYVPGVETVPVGTVGFFGHPSTFDLTTPQAWPSTQTAALPNGLQVRLFALPPEVDPSALIPEMDGLVVLSPGDALPVPY